MNEQYDYDPWKYPLTDLDGHKVAIEAEHGTLVVSYLPEKKIFQLIQIDVDEDHRRHGIAQDLLRHSKELATRMGAKVITASIVSRESYEAISRVFGDEAIPSPKIGEFEEPEPDEPVPLYRRTDAFMLYEIPENNPEA